MMKYYRGYTNYEIYPHVVFEMLQRDRNILLLDVRTSAEYKEGHISGAMLIPDYEIDASLGILGNKNSTIIVYCGSGGRSKRVVEKLRRYGYINSYSMIGGISEWEYGIV